MLKIIKKFLAKLPIPILEFLIKIYVKREEGKFAYFQSDRIVLDDDGVPSVNYGIVEGINIGIQRNPVTISHYVIKYYDRFKTNKDQKSKKLLINCANWLAENAKLHDDYAILEYQFPWPRYDLKKPWRSGMAQGLAIQALILAHKITHKRRYIEMSKILLKSFFYEVKERGVTYKSKDDKGWWYEEFAENDCKISRVLNGMMYGVLGIYEFFEYTHDKEAKFLFDKGIIELKRILPQYDFEGFSYYDILGHPANKYHSIHISQLQRLFEITKEEIFRKYAEKWKMVDYYKYRTRQIFSNFKDQKK